MPDTTPQSALLGALAAALIGAFAAHFLAPDPRLGPTETGDPALAADLAAVVGEGRGMSSVAVARVEGDAVRYAAAGDTTGSAADGSPEDGRDALFELGSVTKTFTGHLLADGVARGELELDAPLATYLPELADTPAGAATLEQLASHTSGLPRVPGELVRFRGALGTGDPYRDWAVDRVVDAARTAPTTAVGEENYSNFGVALLGIAEARAAGVPTWSQLAEERLFQPLGMDDTTVVEAGEPEPDGLVWPRTANGRAVQPWTGDGFAAAGSATRTTTGDLARFATAVLDGTVPGAGAVEPVVTGPDHGRGLGWSVDTSQTPALLSHGGATGGTSTHLVLQPDADRAVVVLAATDADVGPIARHLLLDPTQSVHFGPNAAGVASVLAAILVLLLVLLSLNQLPSRVGALAAVVMAAAAGVALTLLGPWQWALRWAIGFLLGALVGAAWLAVLRAPSAPWLPQRRPYQPVVALALAAAGSAMLGWLLV
ncbi:serine hydrolase domain-containing protein [Propioniciclava soli]|uniref:serine hydrolase domain-containing protein n=1 Tax=Propioniciclava soli TaxID=2775081 RepID=UPI001E4B7A0F|nr:serine hydrolase domain-containing protein [Propioniciclava soli]